MSIKRRNSFLVFTGIVLFTALLIFLWFTFTSQNLMFVFDNSGSMTREDKSPEGQIHTLQFFAKQSIEKTVRDPKFSLAKIGLVKFGGQCKSYESLPPEKRKITTPTDYEKELFNERQQFAELVSPLNQGNREQLIRGLKNISEDPDGATPLGFGIRKAAEELPVRGNSQIIVVTDGGDPEKEDGTGNCGEKPCAVFKEFQSKIPNFAVTIVPHGTSENNPLFYDYKKCGMGVLPSIPFGSPIPIPKIPNPFEYLLPLLLVPPFIGLRWVMAKGIQEIVIFMLDVSGSMGENDKNGKIKVEIARKKIMNLIEIREYRDKKIGLVTFGGECNTLRCKTVPDYKNQTRVIKQLNSFNCSTPNGSTPLAYAIREVTQILSQQNLTPAAKAVRQLNKFNKKPRVIPIIILFTDGFETCNGDPVKEVREAKESGIDFITYIIGYSVNTNEREFQQLPVLARVGGGRYISADTEEELENKFNELNSQEEGILNLKNHSNSKVERWELYKGIKQAGNIPYNSRDRKRGDNLWGSYLVDVGDYELHIFLNENTDSPLVRRIIIRKDQQTDVVI